MTTLNGLVGIDFNLAVTFSTSLSSQRAVLIHQFDDALLFPAPHDFDDGENSTARHVG
jgi:hypothetical protein